MVRDARSRGLLTMRLLLVASKTDLMLRRRQSRRLEARRAPLQQIATAAPAGAAPARAPRRARAAPGSRQWRARRPPRSARRRRPAAAEGDRPSPRERWGGREEERRVGKERVSRGRSGGEP